ncbi:putative ribonuclease H-like domain-containing protein [Tanacetum coccineum]|uniref:Ribonuclease H-like domain-containing protein n=1 Tax=Tanacetum coccineum TaxID=301880 RepID=A0ABQ4ZQ32_9ASTR
MVLRALIMKSGLLSVNTARQVNIAHQTTVNAARPMSYLSKIAHLTVKRPINNNTAFKNSNINQSVNTVRGKNVNTARLKEVVNDVQGNNVNAIKASACWVWKPKTKVLDHVSKHKELHSAIQKDRVEDMLSLGGTPMGDNHMKKVPLNLKGKASTEPLVKTMNRRTHQSSFTLVAYGLDETSGILKSFITRIENLVDHKVKVIRCDNETEFKNREMNQFCEMKGIQSNGFVDPKSSHDDGSKPSSDDGKKVYEDPRKDSEYKDQEKEDNVNSTNNVNAASTNEVNVVGEKPSIELLVDQNMPALEDISIFDFTRDDEDDDFVVGSMDVKMCLSLCKGLEEEVYVCQPPGFEDPDFPDREYKVEKALYGLHQAPRAWYETLSTYLLDNGFQRGKIDKTLIIKRYNGEILLVQVYVDDIVFGSTKKELCNAFAKFTEVKTASTPLETQKPLLKDEDDEEVDVHMYRSMIGSLMYLTSTRPDIMFSMCACARYQVNPKVSHLHDVKRIFRYLKGQQKLGLWYPKDCPFDLVAYTNSDYARASLDKKYTTGGCQFLGSRLISWQCKKQTVVANSTTEAEYVAASSCC